MCISPIIVKGLMVPCGKCIQCKRKRLSDWSCKGWCELQTSKCSYFCTLTYNDENLPEFGCLSKRDFQLFMKRFRKELSKDGITVRFLACGEYGGQFHRPHYHFVLFLNKEVSYERVRRSIDRNWNKGFITVSKANYRTVRYVAKYAAKDEGDFEAVNLRTGEVIPQFILFSRRPGLGRQYCEANELELIVNNYVDVECPSSRRGKSREGVRYGLPNSFKRFFHQKHFRRFADDYVLVHNDLLEDDPDFASRSKSYAKATAIYLSGLSKPYIEDGNVLELSRLRHAFDVARQRGLDLCKRLELKGKKFKYFEPFNSIYRNGTFNLKSLWKYHYFVINKGFLKCLEN